MIEAAWPTRHLRSCAGAGRSGSAGSASTARLSLADLDVQQAADDVAADGALVGLRFELVGAPMAHAHVAARQRHGVARRAHADHTLVAAVVLHHAVHQPGVAAGRARRAARRLQTVDLLQLKRGTVDPKLLEHVRCVPHAVVAAHELHVRRLRLHPLGQLAACLDKVDRVAMRPPVIRERLQPDRERVESRWHRRPPRHRARRHRSRCAACGRERLVDALLVLRDSKYVALIRQRVAVLAIPCVDKHRHSAGRRRVKVERHAQRVRPTLQLAHRDGVFL
mmetsp:Transcript_4012/g.11461  ORF Transcript_4012/g.11461 Transcript_4012/m.11461 type:complete len:280 (-) Transcript_4012:636-1475(-)